MRFFFLVCFVLLSGSGYLSALPGGHLSSETELRSDEAGYSFRRHTADETRQLKHILCILENEEQEEEEHRYSFVKKGFDKDHSSSSALFTQALERLLKLTRITCCAQGGLSVKPSFRTVLLQVFRL